MSLSSPIQANSGTARGLPISCFNVHIPDSIEGITHKLGEVIMQTKVGGGTSGYFGDLRGRGFSITNNGKSSGAVSFMELFNSAIEAVVDRISLDKHELSKDAKDMGSAAQFVSLAIIFISWAIILLK